MNCINCKIKLRVTHTYSAGDSGKTQSLVCPKCEKRYVVTAVCEEASQGEGAYAKAQAIKKDPPDEDTVED